MMNGKVMEAQPCEISGLNGGTGEELRPIVAPAEADHQPRLLLQYNFLNVIQPWHIAPDGIVKETEPF
jgi:hypothetical protein